MLITMLNESCTCFSVYCHKLAVKDAQAALQDKITALENEIQDSVLDVAQRTLDKLREMAPEL
ncbi:hypothetical protein ACVWC5_21175, partial [Escherichia coli]